MKPLTRKRDPELMDQPSADPAELKRSLADLRAVNRWLGGTRVALGRLAGMIARSPGRPVRVLDVATGSADIPLALTAWARGRGIPLRVVATDVHPATLAAAAERAGDDPDIEVCPVDARSLPFADDGFHFALCNTALHHFDDLEAVRVLRELDRVASAGVVVTDLSRSRTALLGVRLLAGSVWRSHPITRHDGPRSVRGAFTPAELRDLARRAGLEDARVRTHPLFRLSLVVDRTRRGPG